MSQPTTATAGGRRFALGYPGQIADLGPATTMQSYSNSSATTIKHGVAVAFDLTLANSVKPWSADADKFGGIAVRNPVGVADASGNVEYARYKSVPCVFNGVIWVQVCEAVTRGDQALIITAGAAGNTTAGAIGGRTGGAAAAGRVAFPGMNARLLDSAASGGMARLHLITTGGVT